MANLTELEQWEAGIRQFEEEDLVEGGPDGVDNIPLRQLANRTAWLKAQAEALGTGKQPLDATLTAIAAIATVADRLIYSTGPDTFALTPLSAFIRTLLDDADAATARATLGAISQAQLDAAIAALVASSPAALDTLNELAAALGNDANFAATVTNALALKAPIASPALTGNPTAPTPAQFDNDTSLATTAFVQRALGNRSGLGSLALGISNLTSATAGFTYVNSGNYASTVNLPPLASMPFGGTFEFVVVGAVAGTITLVPNGADQIYIGNLAGSVTLKNGDSITLVAGSPNWFASSGTSALQYSAIFSKSLSANGYQTLPGGLIIQWGSVNNLSTVTSLALTFPIAFPNNCLVLEITGWTGQVSYTHSGRAAAGATVIRGTSPSFQYDFIAIGY